MLSPEREPNGTGVDEAIRCARVSTPFDGSKRLDNHPGVSHGVGPLGILFGLPFLAAGVCMALVVSGTIEMKPGSVHAPPWVLGALGLVFAIPGALIMLAGVRSLVAQTLRRAALARHPGEPWRADRWDERVARDRASNPLGHFGVAAFITLFFAGFNYFAFGTAEAPILVKLIVAFFDLVVVALWANAFYVLGRRLKYGATKVRLSTFPFHVGHPLKVTVELPSALRDFPER